MEVNYRLYVIVATATKQTSGSVHPRSTGRVRWQVLSMGLRCSVSDAVISPRADSEVINKIHVGAKAPISIKQSFSKQGEGQHERARGGQDHDWTGEHSVARRL